MQNKLNTFYTNKNILNIFRIINMYLSKDLQVQKGHGYYMNIVLEQIKKYGIVPVVVLERLEDAIPLATALVEGGLPIAEITFRTKVAAESIKLITNEIPDMLIGAGTILNEKQVDAAIEAGAQFIVSPGLNPRTVGYCLEKGITMLPGCANPSDIELAIELGLEAVKFFPAEQAGGLPMLKALASPYGDMMFMPTGGIHKENIMGYLQFSNVFACGGSWMVQPDYIKTGNYQRIMELTREVVNMVKEWNKEGV